ncbi:MAG: hypothetical protein ACJ78T_18405 [Myxococcales bacterium]
MKKLWLPAVTLLGVLILAVVALSSGRRDVSAGEDSPAATANTPEAAAPSLSDGFGEVAAPVPVREDKGRLQIVDRPRMAKVPTTAVEPLFEPDARVKIGETTKLRFAVRDRGSELPESLDQVSASVRHGKDPEMNLPVQEVDNGVYEVPFTPHGPGQFTIILSENGNPVGSRSVGAAGVAGASANVDDVDPLLSVDPIAYRARTGARGGRRRR